MTDRQNWAGSVTFGAREYTEPATIEELRQIVTSARRVKVVGIGHSFGPIADTDGVQISTRPFDDISDVNPVTGRVTVGAGVTYSQLCPVLHTYGRALHNLASLPLITVAGACSTGTHGSGNDNRCLSTAVAAL